MSEEKKVRGNPGKLKPIRTKREACEKGRNGGIASGKARRRKASLMRCAQRVLESDMTPKLKAQIESVVGSVDDADDTLFTAATAVMVKEALKGNVGAYRELKDIVREIDGAFAEDDQEEDGLSKALRELGESL